MPLSGPDLLLLECPDPPPFKPAALAHFAFRYIPAQYFSRVDSKPLAARFGSWPTGRMDRIAHFMGYFAGRNRPCGQYRIVWFFAGVGRRCADRPYGVVFYVGRTVVARGLGHRLPVPALPPQTLSHRAARRHERFVDTHLVVGHVFFPLSGN